MGEAPKVEFALGGQVSPGQFFKSSFARSFVLSCHDSKSLNYEMPTEKHEDNVDNKNNNFFSLINFMTETPSFPGKIKNGENSLWKISEEVQPSVEKSELEKLRKQCQMLKEENRRLQRTLSTNQVPHVQVIDNVLLQTQVDTLQWQLKQIETNKQMYRSLMEQVVRFLDRAQKSLDILHKKSSGKTKSPSGSSKVPRSKSVHTVHVEGTGSKSASPLTYSSSNSSKFTRAKSVAQISPNASGLREFTWSVLKRNDPTHCTPPRGKAQLDAKKSLDIPLYPKPKSAEVDPDEVAPEKLSQEAFRLMRTVQSLLSMREPDLARVSPIDESESSPSPIDHHESLSLQNDSFANSTTLDAGSTGSSSDRGNETGSSIDGGSRSSFSKSSSSAVETVRNLPHLLPGARRSLDATSLNSGSSKTTEEDDAPLLAHRNGPTVRHDPLNGISASTPTRKFKKDEKKDTKILRSKPSNSTSSAEDESGFSSMSSFQEIGLPGFPFSPIKGCHTEVGLPNVTLNKARHRRWSATPAEIHSLFKKHNTKSLSVWV
ncbi:uncharacterized protein [Prorops nasuta]|uniref:uncharacterized protein n=1 Tax=Prorops nasuta TaxID=863751 RepID=UPI0034CD7E6D